MARDDDEPCDLEYHFPDLSRAGYYQTSKPDLNYNCFAWVLGETHRCWWPPARFRGRLGPKAYYWPSNVSIVWTMQSFLDVLEQRGYSICRSAEFEEGYEKVAIYARDGELPLHAARQLEDGLWTSKIGECQDITHQNLEALEGSHFGKVAVVLRRPRSA